MIGAAFQLLVYGSMVTWLGPRALQGITVRGITPRLGVAAWLTAILGVIGAWIGAVMITSIEAVRDGGRGDVLTVCLNVLGLSRHIGVPQPAVSIAAIAISAAALTATTIFGRRVVLAARRLREHGRRHARAAQVIGRPTGRPGVVVINARVPVVYCVDGHPPTVVVTTAALDGLDGAQLDAILAHERAHIAGRHHDLLVVLRALAAGLPRMPLFCAAAEAVSDLLEMCADDAAARQHGARPLLSGIATLIGTPSVPALGAAHTAVLARAQRLAHPIGPRLRWGHRLAQIATIGATLALPVQAALTCLAQ
ncbi:MAG: M56 family metallopeptidase [Mycolicibacterium sp.]|uniref:M56 family metallopeptidase n=1 Tax=Mycolicibacterium sp. TaxID=2320850 RepID=UPI003D15345C